MTLDCLESLRRGTFESLRVIVVDNASTDDSVALLSSTVPEVELIANAVNLGFAEGNNVGIRAALAHGADYVLILNNDTIVGPHTIEMLVAEAGRLGAGAVSPLIYFAEPDNLIWFAGADFDARRAYPGRVTGYRERDTGQYSNARSVDRLTGASMLVSREAIERTGMFDGDLFFLYEDVDWSLRMRAAGFHLYVIPEAKVWHRVAATQSGEHSLTSVYYGVRNQLVVSRRHAHLGPLQSSLRTVGVLAVNAARLRRTSDRRRGVSALAQGLVDAALGRLGPWETSGEGRPRR
jgi:GT2 family glycosyltransferase